MCEAILTYISSTEYWSVTNILISLWLWLYYCWLHLLTFFGCVSEAPCCLELWVTRWKELRVRERLATENPVAERTSYFCLARKLIWPLWSSHIFTQWGWLILFSQTIFPDNIKMVKAYQTFSSLDSFEKDGRLSAPCIEAESQHHEESHLIYGPLASTLLD